jgi:hypothetical protein
MGHPPFVAKCLVMYQRSAVLSCCSPQRARSASVPQCLVQLRAPKMEFVLVWYGTPYRVYTTAVGSVAHNRSWQCQTGRANVADYLLSACLSHSSDLHPGALYDLIMTTVGQDKTPPCLLFSTQRPGTQAPGAKENVQKARSESCNCNVACRRRRRWGNLCISSRSVLLPYALFS